MNHILTSVCCLVLIPLGAAAHHSFASEFSRDLPVSVGGVVTAVDWRNPHARFYVDVSDEQNNTVNWNIELRSPNILMRHGWNRNSVQPGDEVFVTGFRAREHPNVARATSVTLNGEPVFATD